MNCAEFRRRLLEDPASTDPELLAHAKACRPCREARQSALEFEERLKAALLLPVQEPPLSGTLAAAGRGRGWAAAAGLALVILLAVWFGIARQQHGDDLPGLVVRHVQSEPELLVSSRPLDAMQVAAVMEGQGYRMRKLPGGVVAALPCWIRNGRGVHLVLLAGGGPVTVLMMPGEPSTDTEFFRREELQGLLMPAVRGSVAVIAASRKDLQESVAYFRQNLMWGERPAVYAF